MTVKIFILSFLFLAAFSAAGEEPAEKLKILMEFASDTVTQNEPFTLNIVVNHPDPDKILMEPPDFSDSFRMERLRIEERFVQDTPRSGKPWTVFEFLLTAVNSGPIELGSFKVNVLEETMSTNPLTVNVREAEENFTATLAWFGQDGYSKTPDSVSAGSPCEAVLRIINWQKDIPYPGEIPLRIDAPQNAIVEYIALTNRESAAGVVLHLRIVPLDDLAVKINRQTIRYEKLPLEIPALTIKVAPSVSVVKKNEAAVYESGAEASASVIAATGTAVAAITDVVKQVSFSAAINACNSGLFGKGRREYLEEAESLWGREEYAPALAVLRRGEHRLFAAGPVKDMRKICEEALGLPPGPGEVQIPFKFLFVVSVIFVPVFIILFFAGKKVRIPAFYTGAALIISLPALLILVFSYFYEENRAVIRQCAAYTAPEADAQANMLFMEGETARIRSRYGSWLYVENGAVNAADKSGWIKKENAVTLGQKR